MKTTLHFDIQRIREAAEMIFGDDDGIVGRWSKKSRVSQPTIREFLKGKPVKIATAAKIVAPTGLELNSVTTLNGKKL